ncbi:MAG: hypothetical protein ACXVEI_13200 [Actinomycetota bacterium]
MIDVTTGTNVVVVLGRGRLTAAPTRFVARAAARRAPLRVLTLGFPVTERQQAFVAEAVDRAFEARVHLDASVIGDPEKVSADLGPLDEVVVVAAGREERRIGSLLARLPS